MSNLITNNWTITNGNKNNNKFTLTNGSMKQAITSLPQDETKYKLEFNCLEIINPKSYFLFKVAALEGKHTYLVPVNFTGANSIDIELVSDIRTCEIQLIGSLTVSDISFYENGGLTQGQKDLISKVESESEKWDKIVEITNEQGNLIAERLEGSINNALNSIFGGNGTMEIVDGTIMFRDGATDALSNMAMRINYAGLAIADSKKKDGSWDWKTFGTGQGFTADYMTTGTLSAITIDGVTITATDILGGKITGAVIDGGTTQEGIIKGYKIIGSTLIGGNEEGIYSKIDSSNPLSVYRPTGKVAELWGAIDGSSYLNLYDRNGNQKVGISSGASSGSETNFTDTGSMNLKVDGALNITGQNGFNIYAWNRTSSPYLELYRSYMNVGNPLIETYIDGSTVYINSQVAGYSFSETDVRLLELEEENRQLALKQSELEVLLMEKGIL